MRISDWSSDVCSSDLSTSGGCTRSPSSDPCTWSIADARRCRYARKVSKAGENPMRTVRHLLEAKNPEVFAIGPDVPVIDAVRLMAEKGIGAVLVMQGGRLAGILSERDYARKVVLQGRASSNTLVRDIMPADVVSVGIDDPAEPLIPVFPANPTT